MSILTWQFSLLSSSLMSLLASRTHEWKAWTISEGGKDLVTPHNVLWVELSLEINDGIRRLRCHNMRDSHALKILEELKTQPKLTSFDLGAQWSLLWKSDGFLSEIESNHFSSLEVKDKQWQLVRGSNVIPSLWVSDL